MYFGGTLSETMRAGGRDRKFGCNEQACVR
jgi:hypothetical protein